MRAARQYLGRMVLVGRDDDPKLGSDLLARPVAELTGEGGCRRKLVGRLDASKAYAITGHQSSRP